MRLRKNERGFATGQFTDANGEACSVQESSAAEQPLLWLGVDDVKPKLFMPGAGWSDVELPTPPPGGCVLTAARMHLTRQQVRALLPHLERFAKTGSLHPRRRT